jgi:hypothetical protein
MAQEKDPGYQEDRRCWNELAEWRKNGGLMNRMAENSTPLKPMCPVVCGVQSFLSYGQAIPSCGDFTQWIDQLWTEIWLEKPEKFQRGTNNPWGLERAPTRKKATNLFVNKQKACSALCTKLMVGPFAAPRSPTPVKLPCPLCRSWLDKCGIFPLDFWDQPQYCMRVTNLSMTVPSRSIIYFYKIA